jgi:hypothetical protein
LALVTGVTVLTVIGASVLGPFITEKVLQYDLSTADMALMAASMGLFMITISLDQSLLALHGHRRMATGWVVTVVAFGVFLWLGRDNDLFVRVEWALVGAGVAGVIAMGTFLVGALRRAERSAGTPSSSQPAPS